MGRINEQQLEAFKEKRDFPTRDVLCPVCHTLLKYEEARLGPSVNCEKCKIYITTRGF